MDAKIHHILSRNKDIAVGHALIDDFDLAPGVACDAAIVVQSPNWSLYSLDFTNGVAVFVELPSSFDLGQAAFVYQVQYAHAVRVLTVPFAQMVALAKTLARPDNLTFLLSTGRCGSTLASRILANIPDVWSVSEPDVFTLLAFHRSELPSDLMQDLLTACTRLLFRPPQGQDIRSFVIKPRSEAMLISDHLQKALPDARCVFLYRDVGTYANSMHRFVQRIFQVDEPQLDDTYFELRWRISSVGSPVEEMSRWFPEGYGGLEHDDFLALAWTFRMKAAQKLIATGQRIASIHYADLITNRRIETTRLLNACGVGADRIETALLGFETDAHTGTIGENTVPATPLSRERIKRVEQQVIQWGMPTYDQERL
ncbi:MAG: hypothetical protein ABJQ34_02925 [Paracoccaceae bacterium]